MSASVAPGGRLSASPAPSPTHGRSSPARAVKGVATLIVGVPAALLGALVGLVEEPPVLLWVLSLAVLFVAIMLIAWRWPVLGGLLVAFFGLAIEYQWFADQLGGSTQALIDSIGDVSPLWFAALAVVAGGLFVVAGIIERHTLKR